MPDDLIERARTLIQAALDANADEYRQLEQSLPHLHGPAKSPARKKNPRRKGAAAVGRGKRPKQVLAALGKAPGTAAELASRVGMTPSGIHPVLKRLHRDGQVAKSGLVYTATPVEGGEALAARGRRQGGKRSKR